MKKILLVHLIFFVVNGNAQKQLIDSLLNTVNSHPQQDSIKVNLLISISSAYSATDTTRCFQYADSAILLAKKLNDESKLAACYDNKAMKYVLNEKTQQAIIYKTLCLQQFLLLKDSIKI